jgi:hypothetical protein
LAGNVLLGAAEGALIGAFVPGAGFATGAIAGAITGFVSDLGSQVANGGDISVGELVGATVRGGVGGFVSGGMLAPIAGIAVKDTLTIAFANVASAELAFIGTISGWALEVGITQMVRGGGGSSRLQ